VFDRVLRVRDVFRVYLVVFFLLDGWRRGLRFSGDPIFLVVFVVGCVSL